MRTLLWAALATQISAGAMADTGTESPLAALDAATILCRGGHEPTKNHAPLHRHLADPAILQASLAVLANAPSLPAPSSGTLHPSAPPQARAPPARAAAAFYARGPPARA